jgi:hypothetical protein
MLSYINDHFIGASDLSKFHETTNENHKRDLGPFHSLVYKTKGTIYCANIARGNKPKTETTKLNAFYFLAIDFVRALLCGTVQCGPVLVLSKANEQVYFTDYSDCKNIDEILERQLSVVIKLFDDYMDCKLSGNNSGKKPTDSSGCLPCILGVLAVLWLITTLFG